jgi:hypothetical protein
LNKTSNLNFVLVIWLYGADSKKLGRSKNFESSKRIPAKFKKKSKMTLIFLFSAYMKYIRESIGFTPRFCCLGPKEQFSWSENGFIVFRRYVLVKKSVVRFILSLENLLKKTSNLNFALGTCMGNRAKSLFYQV